MHGSEAHETLQAARVKMQKLIEIRKRKLEEMILVITEAHGYESAGLPSVS